jgi:peroxiredoxin
MTIRRIAAFLALGLSAMALVVWASRPAPVEAHPDFTLPDLDGRDVTLSSFRGQPIVVNFWETFCLPCVAETPALVDVYHQYKDRGLVMVGVAMHDERDAVRTFTVTYGIDYRIVLSGEREDIANAFAIVGWPTTWFIRRDGTISAVRLGMMGREELERQVRALF